MDAHCHERWTMKSRGIPAAKHALSGLISALLMCIESAAQPEFISPNRAPLATPAGGGCFEVGHRVLGLSWGELSWSRWTLKDDSNLREWASGLSFEGGPRWSKAHAFFGGLHQFDEGTSCMWQMSAGMTSWPFMGVLTPWFECRSSASRDAPWGNVRMEIMWVQGQGLSTSTSEVGSVRGANPWSWTAWWTPRVEGSTMGMPAIGWSQDGQWEMAWSAHVDWGKGLRFWRPPPGSIQIHWRLPAHVIDIGWRGWLTPTANRQGPKTYDPEKRSLALKHAVGCAMRQGQRLPGWRAFWMWERGDQSDKDP